MTFYEKRGGEVKKTTEGLRAHELETIQADPTSATEASAEGAGPTGYVNRKLYVLDGQPGLYRRVARSRKNDVADDGRVLAFFDGGLVELIRVPKVEAELAEAGYHPAGFAERVRVASEAFASIVGQAAYLDRLDDDIKAAKAGVISSNEFVARRNGIPCVDPATFPHLAGDLGGQPVEVTITDSPTAGIAPAVDTVDWSGDPVKVGREAAAPLNLDPGGVRTAPRLGPVQPEFVGGDEEPQI